MPLQCLLGDLDPNVGRLDTKLMNVRFLMNIQMSRVSASHNIMVSLGSRSISISYIHWRTTKDEVDRLLRMGLIA